MSSAPWTACVAVLMTAIGLPRSGSAQSASINVDVLISTTALSIATVADLDFGTVIPGSPSTVDARTSPNAGEFEVHGARFAEFTLSFAMPPALTVGPNAMPISFGPTAGCAVPFVVGLRAACIAFDPTNVYVTRIPNLPPPFNRWLFWLGGTVAPIPAQAPGIYTGTISLTVAYTGN